MSEDRASEDIAGPDILNRSIEELKLSMASMAALRGCHIETVAELVQQSEADLVKRGIAPYEIKEFLTEAGLSLGMRFEHNAIIITPGTAKLTVSDYTSTHERIHLAIQFHSEPPKLGTYLLYLFLSKRDRENIPGDLAEEYATIILPEFGLWRARLWYWKQVICSVWPIIGSRLQRVVAIGGVAKAAYEIYKRLGL